MLTKQYLKKDAIFDGLANFPVAAYFFIKGGLPGTQEEIDAATEGTMVFTIVMVMKTLRLFHAGVALDALKRLFIRLEEIFYMRLYMFENMVKWILASIKLLLSIHYFACGWIIIHSYKR